MKKFDVALLLASTITGVGSGLIVQAQTKNSSETYDNR